MIAIIDYGMGNLRSVQKAFEFLGYEAVITDSADAIAAASHVILPGVGAFEDAMKRIRETKLDQALLSAAKAGKPVLGICLGMQMMFEHSDENGYFDGLGLFPGTITRLEDRGLKIPHMGWNDLNVLHDCPLSADIADGDYVYYVHSYRADTDDAYISCYTMYNEKIPGLVYCDNVYGAQFHPEKSGQVGMNILKNFAKLVRK